MFSLQNEVREMKIQAGRFTDKYESKKYDFDWLKPNVPAYIVENGYNFFKDGRVFGRRGHLIGTTYGRGNYLRSSNIVLQRFSNHQLIAERFVNNPRPDIFLK